MKNNKLPKNFFKENPLASFSAAKITHFKMTTLTMSEMDKKISDMVVPTMEQSRLEKYQEEKETIINLNKAEDIIGYMRKIKDPVNTNVLLKKALEFQHDLIPLVLKRICTSGHIVFIENAAIILANAEDNYTDQLYALFPQIKNAYARSELSIVFGVKKKAEYTDLLITQYKQIKQERPDETYEQGPLLALYLIYGKE